MPMRRARNLQAGDRVRLRGDHLGLSAGTRGKIVRVKAAWRAGRIVFVRFDGVFGTTAIDRKVLSKLQPEAGRKSGDETAVLLLREMVELFGERPYQALGKKGPYVCLFCGETTKRENEPKHMEDCPWPRVLELFSE